MISCSSEVASGVFEVFLEGFQSSSSQTPRLSVTEMARKFSKQLDATGLVWFALVLMQKYEQAVARLL